MKKTKLFRLLFMLAVAVTVIAASAVIASATDYKYTKEVQTSKGTVTIAFDQNPDLFIFKRGGVQLNYKITLPESSELTSLDLGESSWKKTGENPTVYEGYAKFYKAGIYGMVGMYKDGYRTETFYDLYCLPAKPVNMKITSYPTHIVFDAHKVSALECGTKSGIFINNDWKFVENGTAGKISDLKNKSYKVVMCGTMEYGDSISTGEAIQKTVPMGPKMKPVIKSVKISNVKVKKYFNYQEWRYRYKTSYTMTVTLSKKPKNIKGVDLLIQGMNGLNDAHRTVKGKGNTFKTSVTMDSIKSYKNGKVKVIATAYTNNTYKAYSYDSKGKVVKIK